MLAAVTIFIEEFFPSIGICVVISDNANRFLLTPEISEPRIRQIVLFSAIDFLRLSEVIAILVAVNSRAMMKVPACFKVVTRSAAFSWYS